MDHGITEIEIEPVMENGIAEPSVNAAVLARQRERKYERVKTNAILNVHLSKRKRDRYLFVGFITAIYCLAEIGVAIGVDSLALLSDGFHNLGDLAAILLAYWCEKNKSKRTGITYTYGYKRAEVLGGLANACSLLSLSFYIVLESIPRFYNHAQIQSGGSFIAIAAVGLAINTLGTVIFACSGMEPGGGGAEDQKESNYNYKEISVSISSSSNPDATADYVSAPSGPALQLEAVEPVPVTEEDMDIHKPQHALRSKSRNRSQKKDENNEGSHVNEKSDLNMRAMFLHFLGDSIASCTVLLEGVLLMVGANSGSWVNYVDPVFSLIIVSIIVVTTIPLVKECTHLLLHVCPSHLDMETIFLQLKKVPGVLGVHDLHIWAVTPGLIVSSLHFNCLPQADIRSIVASMKSILHQQGIHSSAIQPEFVEGPPSSPYTIVYKCEENCTENCEKEWCCYNDHDYL